MTELTQDVADNLEQYGSSRADFRKVSDTLRKRIARRLIVARSQVKTTTGPSDSRWDDELFRSEMRMKRQNYHYECGAAGIEQSEVDLIWWNFVYDDLPPAERERVV